MDRRLRLFTLLSVISGLLIILVLSLPTIAERVGQQILERFGFSETVLEISDIDLKSIHVPRMQFVYKGHGYRLDLRAHDIRLNYRLGNLLSGRLDHIQLPEVEVRSLAIHSPLKTKSTIKSPPPGIVLPGQFLPKLPFEQLSLEHIRVISQSNDGRLQQADVRGEIHVQEGNLQARLDIAAQDRESLSVDVAVMQSGVANLSVYRDLSLEPFLSLKNGPRVLEGDRQLTDIELETDLQQLRDVLTAWKLIDSLPMMSGKFKGNGSVNLPVSPGDFQHTVADLRLQANTQLNMEIAHINGIANEIKISFPFAVTLQEGILQWKIYNTVEASCYPLFKKLFAETSEIGLLLQKQGRQQLRLTAPNDVTGQFQIDAGLETPLSVQTDDSIRLDFGSEMTALELQLELQALSIDLQAPLRAQSDIAFTVKLQDKNLFPANSAYSKGVARITLADNKLAFALGSNTELDLQELVFGPVATPSTNTKLVTTANCHYLLTSAEWYCGAFELGVTMPATTIVGSTLHSGPGRLKILSLGGNNRNWSLQAQSNFSDISITGFGHSIYLDHMQADIQADQDSLMAQVKLKAAENALNAHINATHKQRNHSGQADFTIDPIRFSQESVLFDHLFGSRPWPIDLNGGQLAAEGNLTWRPGGQGPDSLVLEQATKIRIQGMNGTYQETTFQGLDVEFTIQGLKNLFIENTRVIRLTELNPGLPITDVEFNLRGSIGPGQAPLITVDDLSAKALGGYISSDPIVLDLNRERNSFTFKVNQLDIEELLKLEQRQGLYGTGIVDGVLPLELTRDGLYMNQGSMVARAPGGIIRYIADERVKNLVKSDPNLELLLNALSDLHYQLLEAAMDYTPDGHLDITLKLEGNNPQLESGRPIHLNVNIEENVLQLLRSLRLSKEIGKKIGERIQQRKQIKE